MTHNDAIIYYLPRYVAFVSQTALINGETFVARLMRPSHPPLSLKFFAHVAGGTFGVLAGATVKNFDTLWRFSKEF
jgi:hypothetical protein